MPATLTNELQLHYRRQSVFLSLTVIISELMRFCTAWMRCASNPPKMLKNVPIEACIVSYIIKPFYIQLKKIDETCKKRN